MWLLVLGLVTVAVLTVGLAASTAAGARRRGRGWPLSLASGALFPLTWALWYVADAQKPPRGR